MKVTPNLAIEELRLRLAQRDLRFGEGKRVVFERPIEARLMAIDGTWQRPCKIHDVAETSANW
ncbi:hypothetical protein ACVWXN_008536 [Bradyrhizobium sp. i1.4.4]